MHLSEGEIRAYQDHELDPAVIQRVQSHLETCSSCQKRADQVSASNQFVQSQMAMVNEQKPQYRLSPMAARMRLEARQSTQTKELENMSKKWYNRISRPAWTVIGIVLVLAISMAFAPVRAIANSFLGLFRVQQIQVVQVNPGALPNQLGNSSQLEAMLSQDVQFQDDGQVQPAADAAEASSLAGMSVRLPQGLTETPTLKVTPAGTATLKVDAQHLKAVLAEIGRNDIQIPKLVDGATITLQVQRGVQAFYGDCQSDMEKARQQGFNPDTQSLPRLPHCTTLVQMPSPTIQAPPGLDIQKIGEAYLQVLGMSQQEAQAFAQTVDWTTTFVIPMPRYDTSTQQVAVDGVTGSLVQQGTRQYLLLWVKDGIVYALTGPGDAATALQVAGSLQ